jgi:hypothetical protein
LGAAVGEILPLQKPTIIQAVVQNSVAWAPVPTVVPGSYPAWGQ